MSKTKVSQTLTEIEIKLLKLIEEHRQIDMLLSDMNNPVLDPLLMKRLKKEKLNLKDQIQQITNRLTPNIIA
tara:strand:+ start:126 stop:341 length:216 start_codon:yes stop_codon:yes gene_type:complete